MPADRHVPLRVAFVGKGGVGKSLAAGTAARLLARRGLRVLAVDSDPMPGLALSLGLAAGDAGLPDELVVPGEAGARPRYRLRADLSVETVIERYAALAPDGVRFLQLGKFRGHRGEHERAHWAFQQVLDGLVQTGWCVVGDLPGGTRQPFFGWARYAGVLVVVVEATASSLLAARRLARLGGTGSAPRMVAVVGKARAPGDAATVRARTGLPVLGTIPYDPLVAAAERAGQAPLDAVPEAPAVRAVASLVAGLQADAAESGDRAAHGPPREAR